jgi:hypothetical protein
VHFAHGCLLWLVMNCVVMSVSVFTCWYGVLCVVVVCRYVSLCRFGMFFGVPMM